MSWRPQLNVVCGRCGKPRGLMHECVSNSRRKQTIKPQLSFGTCPQLPQALPGQPARARLRAEIRLPQAQGRAREGSSATRPARSGSSRAHDYTACGDNDCKRALCVAYKTGWKAGDEAGYDRGWQQGHEAGFKEGYAAGASRTGSRTCPRDHK